MISKASGSKEALNFEFDNKLNSNNDFRKKIVLANKGDMGYMQVVDMDGNGIITLDEFDEYCDKNEITDEARLKLMTVMTCAKKNDAIIGEQVEKAEEKEENKEKENRNIYARRGEEKYVEEMDENKDSVVTYDEYINYCEKYASSNKEEDEKGVKSKEFSEALKAYSEYKTQEVEIKVDEKI